MANTFVLGGSPLGLIGVKSRPTSTGMSTFNGGDSRDININSYNSAKEQSTNISVGGNNLDSTVSLFTGGSIPKFWANIAKSGTDETTTGLSRSEKYKGINRSALHSNEVYDTSVLNIIEKLSFSPKASLRPQDFAYLKNLGVYPNNRLMIARRFSEPQKDNIMDKGGSIPLAVLISWKPEEEDFIDFTYGEEWEDADADFTSVLNKLGGNFGIGGKGSGLGKGLNVVPLTGFTEVIQRQLMTNLGILGPDGDEPLPSGNPNLIKEAKRRKTVPYGSSGSGLMAKISIKIKVEYEQKFISGIDPTIAWMDIMNNALSFGTSNSDNYGLSPEFDENIKKWTGPGGTKILISKVIESITESLKDLKNEIVNSLLGTSESSSEENKGAGKKSQKRKEKEEKDKEKDKKKDSNDLFDKIVLSVEKTIEKYRVELMGIAHSLSGLPSTPWHITVGNPLRPIFCSGDMYTDNLTLRMGPTLAFNDLPSNITIEFTLKNARNLGLQEILAKFNTGYLRVVNVRKDYITSNFTSSDNDTYYDDIKDYIRDDSGNTVSDSGSNARVGKDGIKITTKENG